MSDRRFHLMLGTTLVVAAVSALGVLRVLRLAEDRQRVRTRAVVVAAVDLPEGHVIAAPQLRTVQLPVGATAADAYAVADSVVGRVARVPIFVGEALVPGRLAPVGAGAGLEIKIAPGRRAMAVKIDEVAGLAGLIQPNSRVDVLVTLKTSLGTNSQRAKLFMSNMRVLSVGAQLERGSDGRPATASTAALEVTPDEAERLAVAANEGRIQLVLRGYGDPDSVRTDGANSADILRQLDAAPAARAESPRPPQAPRPRATALIAATPPPKGPSGNAAAIAGPVAPSRPVADSTVVQVYRRDKVSQQKIARGDSARRDSMISVPNRIP